MSESRRLEISKPLAIHYLENPYPYIHMCKMLNSLMYQSEYKFESENEIYDILKKYDDKYYYQYHPSGILLPYKEGKYLLYIRKKANRMFFENKIYKCILIIEDNGSVSIQINHQPPVHLGNHFNGLVLLTTEENNLTFNFHHSIKKKEKVRHNVANLFPQDHFISFVFGAKPSAIKTSEFIAETIPKVKAAFGQKPPLVNLTIDMENKPLDLKTDQLIIHESSRKRYQTGSICIFLHGHSNAGKAVLYSDADTQWKAKDILRLFEMAQIPKEAKIDIDVYACCAGMSKSKDKISFIQTLSNEMRSANYNNIYIMGSTLVVYHLQDSIKGINFSLVQNTQFVATAGSHVKQFQNIFELQNTELLQRIWLLNPETHSLKIKKAEKILQTRVEYICEEAALSLEYSAAFFKINSLFLEFNKKQKQIIELQNICKDIYKYRENDSTATPSGRARRALMLQAYTLFNESNDFYKNYNLLLTQFLMLKRMDELMSKIIENKINIPVDKVQELIEYMDKSFLNCVSELEFQREYYKARDYVANFYDKLQVESVKTTLINSYWKLSFWQKDNVIQISSKKEEKMPTVAKSIWEIVQDADNQKVSYYKARYKIHRMAQQALHENAESIPYNMGLYKKIASITS